VKGLVQPHKPRPSSLLTLCYYYCKCSGPRFDSHFVSVRFCNVSHNNFRWHKILLASTTTSTSAMLTDPFLSLPIHTPQDKDPQGYKYKHSLSVSISPVPLNKQSVHDPTDIQSFFRNLSRSASNECNANIMANNDGDLSLKQSLTMSPPSSCASSRCASPAQTNSLTSSNAAVAAAMNTAMNKKTKQKNDRAVEVLDIHNVVIARFRTQTECSQYLRATPEAVSYHCSKNGGGVCNGLVIRPCDASANQFGLFDGAEEARPKKRPQLKPDTVAILKEWILSPEHMQNPYPNENEMKMLMQKTGLDKTQLRHWFNNARKRILKPILGKNRATGSHAESVQRQGVQEKRRAASERPTKRISKKAKVDSVADSSSSSGTSSPSELPLSQFGSIFGSERAGAGSYNSMAMGMITAGNPISFGFNQDCPASAAVEMSGNPFATSQAIQIQGNSIGNSSFPPQQQIQPSPVVFKQQVASMAMKEAHIAFKNLEDAYAIAKETMNMLASSGSTNIEDHPRVIRATALAKKLHSVALFKLKVSKRASEEAKKAFEMIQCSLS